MFYQGGNDAGSVLVSFTNPFASGSESRSIHALGTSIITGVLGNFSHDRGGGSSQFPKLL